MIGDFYKPEGGGGGGGGWGGGGGGGGVNFLNLPDFFFHYFSENSP